MTFVSKSQRDSHLVVSALDVWISDVALEADSEPQGVEVTHEAKVKIDAMTGTATPDPVQVELGPGTYESLFLSVELWDDGDEPALTLEGTLDGVPIRFLFNSAETFEAEGDRLVVAEGETYPVTFTLKPEMWFATISGANLEVGADGVAEISDSSNASVYDTVAERLDHTTDGHFPGASGEVDTGDVDTGDVDTGE